MSELWCPTCEEYTALVDAGVCSWCDGPLIERKRRGGWKRPDLHGGRYTDAMLRALYRAHIEQGLSINELAKRTYARVGYKTHGSAASRISEEWQRLGLPARDRIEATRLASTTHGHGARDRDEQGYRRFLRDQRGWNSLQGPGRPDCKGVKRQPPGQGQPCQRHAMEGSDFCAQHDPTRELVRQAHLAAMRRRLPPRDVLPMEPFAAWLRSLLAEHGSMREVARLLDGPYTALCQYAKGKGTDKQSKPTIGRTTVERYASAAGVGIDVIYDPKAIAA
jgi:hypothetical protein